MMYINQTHNIYIKTIPVLVIKHKRYWKKLWIQYLSFQNNTSKNQDFHDFFSTHVPISGLFRSWKMKSQISRLFPDQWEPWWQKFLWSLFVTTVLIWSLFFHWPCADAGTILVYGRIL